MRLELIRALPGPNVYLDRPVLWARIELDALTNRESCDVSGFVSRLLARLPLDSLSGDVLSRQGMNHICAESIFLPASFSKHLTILSGSLRRIT